MELKVYFGGLMSKSLYIILTLALLFFVSENLPAISLEQETETILKEIEGWHCATSLEEDQLIDKIKQLAEKPNSETYLEKICEELHSQCTWYSPSLHTKLFDTHSERIINTFFLNKKRQKLIPEIARLGYFNQNTANILIKNPLHTFSSAVILALVKYADRSDDLDQKLVQLGQINNNFFKKLPVYLYYKKYGLQKIAPSAYHLVEVLTTANCYPYFKQYKKEASLRAMVNNLVTKQQELDEQGYYTFFHGQRWRYLQQEEFFTKLWELDNKKSAPDFLFLHMKKLTKNKDLIDEAKMRKKLLKNGRQNQSLRDISLFMNRFYFGNTNRLGSSTAKYVADNDNAGNVRFTLEDIFDLHNLSFLYKEFKKELVELEQEFQQVSSYGAAILLAIPKSTIRDMVYLADVGGYKKTITTKDGKEISDIVDALETLMNNQVEDIDCHEFVLAMTEDKLGGLNPESGIKIFAFNAADPAKYAAYKAKEAALWQKIEEYFIKKTEAY